MLKLRGALHATLALLASWATSPVAEGQRGGGPVAGGTVTAPKENEQLATSKMPTTRSATGFHDAENYPVQGT